MQRYAELFDSQNKVITHFTQNGTSPETWMIVNAITGEICFYTNYTTSIFV